jgi:hypothetical protein
MSYFKRTRARKELQISRPAGDPAVEDWAHLHRMLVLGAGRGSYCGPEHALSREGARAARARSEPWRR